MTSTTPLDSCVSAGLRPPPCRGGDGTRRQRTRRFRNRVRRTISAAHQRPQSTSPKPFAPRRLSSRAPAKHRPSADRTLGCAHDHRGHTAATGAATRGASCPHQLGSGHTPAPGEDTRCASERPGHADQSGRHAAAASGDTSRGANHGAGHTA